MSIGRLDNKVILVTGANTGVGEHTARLCIEQGAKVAVHGRRKEAVDKIVDELGPNAIGVYGSLDTADEPARVVEQTIEAFGRLDGVVNNAASTARMFFENTDVDFFRHHDCNQLPRTIHDLPGRHTLLKGIPGQRRQYWFHQRLGR
jgi:NAD(P)-dependent dehydrogenase (short-subunit alcohol dehydrogenase family)